MEVSEKDYSRALRRKSTQRKQDRAQRVRKGTVHPQQAAEPGLLDTNAARYAESDEDGVEEPGQYRRQSKGADLAVLLAESKHLDSITMHRSRKLLDFEAQEAVPPQALEEAQEALELDFRALADSLSTLPEHVLLGVDERLWSESSDRSALPSEHATPSSNSLAQAKMPAERSPSSHEPSERESSGQPQALVGHGAESKPSAKIGSNKTSSDARDEVLEQLLASSRDSKPYESAQAVRDSQQSRGTDDPGGASSSSAREDGPTGSFKSHQLIQEARGAAEVELDELLGMCNAEAPELTARHGSFNRTQKSQSGPSSDKKAVSSSPVAASSSRELPYAKVPAKQIERHAVKEQDLEDWLNSL